MAAQKGYRIILHQGGSRSTKTYSIFQFFIEKALAGESASLTIVRDKLTWVKGTLLKDFEDMQKLYSLPIYPNINVNRPEQIYFINNFEFSFWGLDYSEKLHGKKQDYTWGNEAMEIDKKAFDQLEMRTSKLVILDFNPYDDSHWCFALKKRPDVFTIVSTQLDNPFLELPIRKKILSYEPTLENIAVGTADSYMWDVYGLGKPAALKGAVLTNWDIVDSVPPDAKFIGRGMDYGYKNHPTALIALYMYNNELYWDEEIYETGLMNPDIAKKMSDLNISKVDRIWGDSAEPKSNDELCNLGWDVRSVVKGADSINFGLGILQGYKIHLTKRSINSEKEFRKYKYAEDKNGNSLNKPIDDFNHAIDAGRYCAMMELKTESVATEVGVISYFR